MITNVTLTTKEKFLLEDMKSHEEQCILKYDNYQNLACDPQLKAVFRSNGQIEQEHLQTINQLLSGKVPSMSGGQSGSQSASSGSSGGQQSMSKADQLLGSSTPSVDSPKIPGFNISDKDMCMDMLTTEKHVSSAYDTAIFECKDAAVRDALNHIQKEEQKHGQAISSYMISKGMYTLK
ncbi:MAG TPA: spore coat protein [Clostridiales bacterium]|nr:spore coat protein [Clostridiales bacterium]